MDEWKATKTSYLVGKGSGGSMKKGKSRRKGRAVKRPVVYEDFSDSDDPANAYTEFGEQFQSPGQQNEPTAEAAYFSDTEVLTSTGETVCEMIDRVMAGPNISISDGEESTEQFNFIHELNHPEIVVRRVQYSKFAKKQMNENIPNRWYNPLHACPFGCQGLKTNFSVHVKSQMHAKEPEAKKIKEANREESRRLICLLRMKADHEHNRRVIAKKKGEILLARKDHKGNFFNIENYGPCPYCFEWLSLSFVKRHIPDCLALKDDTRRPRPRLGEIKVQSRILSGILQTSASQLLQREVLPIMRTDAIGVAAQSDDLIIALGNEWMFRNVGNKISRRHYTSQVMRMAGRLKLELNDGKEEPMDLRSYISPQFFPDICRAVMRVARQDEDNDEEFGAPSNAIKLKYDLKRLGCLKLSEAIIEKNDLRKSDAEEFIQLMNIRYSDNLAKVSLFNKKLNERKPLPLPEDVKKLAKYINDEMEQFDHADVTYTKYHRAVSLAQAKLISFNRRRCGEVQQIL